MKTMTRCLVLIAALGFASFPNDTKAADVPEKAIGEGSAGKVYDSQSANGLKFHYLIPRSYDEEKGASLTVMLHGSNLDRRWGFANHKAGDFRPNDIVVSPDGTTSNGQGGFNFMGRPEDAEKFTAFLDEFNRGPQTKKQKFVRCHSSPLL